jgi:membrane protein DedA with SNARE-associated domain
MNASFVNHLVEVLEPLFNSWGYLIIMGGVFLESIFLTGWIAPGTAVILLGSFYAAQGELNLAAVLIVAFVGGILGDNVGYFIGSGVGHSLMEKYGNRPRLMKGMEASQRYFDRYGPVTVLFGRMVSGIDSFIPVTAGMSEMPYWKYLVFDLPGAAIWVGLIGTLGYLFGNNWETIEEVINWFGWGLLGLVALIVVIIYLVHKARKKRVITSNADESQETRL